MEKKTWAIVLGGLAVVVVFGMVLTAAGLWIGSAVLRARADAGSPTGGFFGMMGRNWDRNEGPYTGSYGGPGMMWGNRPWDGQPSSRTYRGPGMMGGNWNWPDMPFGSVQNMPCGEDWQGHGMMGPGMMGGNWNWEDMPYCQGTFAPDGQSILTLEEAKAAVERYVEQLNSTDLQVTEVMEFEQNFYAIVAEQSTGIGAMELLVNKSNGRVGLEPGPNMMWNAKYGMHGSGMMGRGMMGDYATGEMTVSPQEAEEIAQRWLDANLPGRTAGEADPFYGYYTLHFLKDGEIEGMLSVHGSSGDVWYHSWHGGFIEMIGDHE